MHIPSRPHLLKSMLAAALVGSLSMPSVAAPAPKPGAKAPPAAKVPVDKVARKLTSVEGITEYRLTNGLRVLLFPDPSVKTITVNLTYLVGSRHEGYGETGMAHLLEHMLFKGSTRHKNIPQELSEHGARPNGTTWFDRTNYYETFTASDANLRWALSLEADRMVNSFVAKKDLDSEMTVVRNEYEMGENDPKNVLSDRVFETAYLWHNYGNPTIGARSDIEKVPIERLQAFYHRYYQPDNAILVVAGKIDEAATLKLVCEYFAGIPKPTRKLFKTYTEEPTQDGERTVTLRRVGDVQAYMVGYHIPPGSHPDFVAADILGQILADGPSSRLYKALVDTKKATSVYGGAYQLREPGFMVFLADTLKEGNLDEVESVLLKTVEGLGDAPPTQQEVDRARAGLLKGIDLTLNNTEKLALQLSEWAALGDWRHFFLYRDRLPKVTPEDVQRVAKAYLMPSNRTSGRFIPTPTPVRAEVPWVEDPQASVANYKGRPPISQGEAFDPSPANIDSRTRQSRLPNGMQLSMLEKQTRGDVVNLTLMLRFGDVTSLAGRATAADMASYMLSRGTTSLNREQIKEKMDALKAQVSLSGGADYCMVSVQATHDTLSEVLALVGDMLLHPSFPAQEYDTLTQALIANLEESRNDPDTLAGDALQRHLNPYPKEDPRYTETPDESLASLKATNLEQATAFYKSFYGANAGQVAVVGDFDAAATEKQLTELLGNWKSPQNYARLEDRFFEVAPLHTTLTAKDKANAVVEAGQNLKLRDDNPDYPALVLGNYMLGGGFLNSRLATRIRQKEGLSYGVGSSLSADAQDESGMFFFYAICAPENADKVETAFFEELRRVLKDGYSADEVAKAKSGYLQSRERNRANDKALASTLARYSYLNRTFAWDAEFDKKIEALTPEQIAAAMRKHLDPDKISVVKAGDFDKVKKP